MKIGIFINYNKDKSTEVFIELKKILNEHNKSYIIVEDINKNYNIDLLIVIGGDGTLLRVVNFALENKAIILSINTGNLGFLSSLESYELNKIVPIIKGESTAVKECTLLQVNCNGKKYVGLNDCYIESSRQDYLESTAVLDFKLDKKSVSKFSGNGIIISTQVGSTAYSLSSGGAVLSPGVKAFIATKICPHSLSARPIVFSEDQKVSITVTDQSSKCYLYIDGIKVDTLECNSKIDIEKHKEKLKLIDTKKQFFNILKTKIK